MIAHPTITPASALPPAPPALDLSKHPCFNAKSKGKCARIHLPVAPKCNVQCNFCDRKYDCCNESRPGVTSSILSPGQALEYTRQVMARETRISVAGIAGPGDPFANAPETLETLRLLRESFPAILLCVATNGLELLEHVEELARLQVSHVTVTVNGVDPEIAGRSYAWVRYKRAIYRGRDAGRFIWERQAAAIRALKKHGLAVKINTIVVPGINDHHVPEIARTVKALGVDVLNCIPLCPVPTTPFGTIPEPTPAEIKEIRAQAAVHIPQMYHCTRCRADAVGLLGQDQSGEMASCLHACATGPTHPAQRRPYVAVASWEGVLVNQHLGEATHLWIFKQTPRGTELVESRVAPAPGGGPKRWEDLAETLKDCRLLLTSGIGGSPREILSKSGIVILELEGLIEEALTKIWKGDTVLAAMRRREPTGCGTAAGCAGPGTGCG
ncbi:MAG: radical SAM protein [Phycisphaerae bacterium]